MVGEALLYNATVQLGPRNGGGVVKLSSLEKHVELNFCSFKSQFICIIKSITKGAPMGVMDWV